MFTQLLTLPPIRLKDAGDGNFDFSLQLDAVVMRALSRSPADRFPSVVTFAKAFVEAANISPEEPGMIGKFRGLLRRNR
jgi:serine/threonine-protein kinase